MVYLYTLTDPRPGRDEIYVGGSRHPKQRFRVHILCHDDWQSRKTKWIEALKREGVRPILTILEGVEDADAPAAESKLIDYWRNLRGARCVNQGFYPIDEAILSRRASGETPTAIATALRVNVALVTSRLTEARLRSLRPRNGRTRWPNGYPQRPPIEITLAQRQEMAAIFPEVCQ
jgi:hypothetical protein